MKHVKLFESWLNENTDEKLRVIADALGCSPEKVVSFTLGDGVNSEEHEILSGEELKTVFGSMYSKIENYSFFDTEEPENVWVADDEESEVNLYTINNVPFCVEDGDRWNGEGNVPVFYICHV